MTMLVKSSPAAAGGISPEVGSGKTSRKIRQVGKMENIVRITWEEAGRERSPA